MTRLELTPAQRARAEPCMRESYQRRAALAQDAMRGGSLTALDRIALHRGIETERRRMMTQLDGLLTRGQLNALRRMEEEWTGRR